MAVFTSISLCSGYEGIGIGLKKIIPNFRTICYVEREAFAVANLVAKIKKGALDDAPIWDDLTDFNCEPWIGKVDIITGGYPCQPFSHAGQRKGTDDRRHLWPHIRRIVNTIRPGFCFFENVEGHITLGLSTVVSDLAEMGYQTTWGLFSAEEVGAPQPRKRVFVLAKSSRFRWGRWNKEFGEYTRGLHLGNASDTRLSDRPNKEMEKSEEIKKFKRSNGWPARPNERQYRWEPPRTVKPAMGGNLDGTPDRLVQSTSRVDELRLLGNGCVPQTVTKAWIILNEQF